MLPLLIVFIKIIAISTRPSVRQGDMNWLTFVITCIKLYSLLLLYTLSITYYRTGFSIPFVRSHTHAHTHIHNSTPIQGIRLTTYHEATSWCFIPAWTTPSTPCTTTPHPPWNDYTISITTNRRIKGTTPSRGQERSTYSILYPLSESGHSDHSRMDWMSGLLHPATLQSREECGGGPGLLEESRSVARVSNDDDFKGNLRQRLT